MAKQKEVSKKSPGSLFIPAGVLIGLGLGFLLGNIPAYLLIGLGAGFLIWALYEVLRKK